MSWFDEMESKIPRGGVRTRFAPSPTGYMHVGGLRTALYAYLIAKKSGGTFILRIEDTDSARYVEGATDIIIDTLKGAGLEYDEGPDIGGPAAPYTQSERKSLYRPYAEMLCEKGAAYHCFCGARDQSPAVRDQETEDVKRRNESPSGQIESDPCRALMQVESKQRVDAGEPFVIRMKAPRDGSTTVSDMVFGEITARNDSLDDMILLKSDGMPTYNFANVIDDHLMGVTHVMRGSEYISSAPKYNLLYTAFGWDIPAYITVSPVMRDAQNKLSKRHGDPTYDDLLRTGYLPGAVLNYVALLGWSPGGEREFFTLPEMIEVFDIGGISKSPAIFDAEKLNYFNSEYIRAMPPEEFAKKAQPYIRQAVKNESLAVGAIAAILQARCEKLSDIPEKIGFFDILPEYSSELYIHKKSKTDEAISLDMLRNAYGAFVDLHEWTNETVHEALVALAAKLDVKNATLMWPVRIAVSGMSVTPGGAVEICGILGRDETLRRIVSGIDKLGGAVYE
ncbi:MAG: glutamate--tRNA ligase [Oscillospiraceae bacterium]|jgi:glutamyl-tRNA synthetase|nr:glutamate--tRNA ligase [Oscillospiraceae bacterium]